MSNSNTTTAIICNTALALSWPEHKLHQMADAYVGQFRGAIPADKLAEADMARSDRSVAYWRWMSDQLIHYYKYQ